TQLHRTAPDLRVALLDAGARAARGLAYGTPYGAHLLNVPAAKMSAFAGEPDHFLDWLRPRMPGANAKTFAPRSLYGEYLGDVLAQTCTPPSHVTRISGTVVGLIRESRGWKVHLHDDTSFVATSIVLALGNLPPADPLSLRGEIPGNYLRDPWAP